MEGYVLISHWLKKPFDCDSALSAVNIGQLESNTVMATFSKNTFNTVKYAVARPTYPRQLFDFIFRYHEEKSVGKPRWDTAVDLGCGTGMHYLHMVDI